MMGKLGKTCEDGGEKRGLDDGYSWESLRIFIGWDFLLEDMFWKDPADKIQWKMHRNRIDWHLREDSLLCWKYLTLFRDLKDIFLRENVRLSQSIRCGFECVKNIIMPSDLSNIQDQNVVKLLTPANNDNWYSLTSFHPSQLTRIINFHWQNKMWIFWIKTIKCLSLKHFI